MTTLGDILWGDVSIDLENGDESEPTAMNINCIAMCCGGDAPVPSCYLGCP